MTIPKIPPITPELIDAIGLLAVVIIVAWIAAGFITTWQEQSEAEKLRDNAEDIVDMINRRDSYYGE